MGLNGPKEIWLGNDNSMTDMNIGSSGQNEAGTLYQTTANHEPDTSSDHAEAGVKASHGHGSLTAWAWVGRDFEIQDNSGSQTATITADGSYFGSMSYDDGGSNYVHMEMIIEDYDDQKYYDETIFEKSDYNGNPNGSYVQSMDIELRAGHTYAATIKVTSEISLAMESFNAFTFTDFYDDSTNLSIGSFEVDF